jgi:hypothetical protein
VKKHQLRSGFRPVFPDVYVQKDLTLTIRHRATAGWLWTRRQGVIAGLTAAALHGAKWVDDCLPVELVWSNVRAAPGLRTYDMRLRHEELGGIAGLPVTTPLRTAFDIGRRGRLGEAVARLDALGNATGFTAEDVLTLASHHSRARGVCQLRAALGLYDPGAASPKESWLRMLLINAGFPRPTTQIPITSPDGSRQYYLDMGWEDVMVAAEYDGEQHRLDPAVYTYDIQRSEDIAELGWLRVRVVKRNRADDVVARVQRAYLSRLRTDREIS